jgi:signal transduction histidine kinase
LWILILSMGLGIREEELPHVFEARVQGKEGKKGLAGLGLFSAKTVVDGHKGKIWVESRFGKGSTFFVELPVASVGGVG